MRFRNRSAGAEVHFQCPKRGDEDAGRGFLADPAPAPALLQGPLLLGRRKRVPLPRCMPLEVMPAPIMLRNPRN